MTTQIECTLCDSEGWNSYWMGTILYIDCATCEREIEGDFKIGADGWIERIEKVGA